MTSPAIPLEVTVAEANALVTASPTGVSILDVREPNELAICQVRGAQHIPMRKIPDQTADLPRDRHILVLCHHGQRSMVVTQFLRTQGFPAVSNIAGGIEAWAEQIDPEMARY